MTEPRAVRVFDYSSPEQFQAEICPLREPAVLRGCPLGSCSEAWASPGYLAGRLGGLVRPVHLTRETNMNFLQRNFTYHTMELSQLVVRASEKGEEKLYLRAVSEENPRTKPVSLEDDFPSISGDFSLPAGLLPPQSVFSSVLRVSSGDVRVWTHYDVMDNIYCQIVGHKKAVLWPPTQVDRLYLQGDKSRVIDIEQPDTEQFPLFALAERYETELEPGDVLFIPALWFHNMLALDFGVAVNVFWRELEAEYYDPRDPYGNKDHLPAARALQSVETVLKHLAQLPPGYRDFYCRRIVQRLQEKCCNNQE